MRIRGKLKFPLFNGFVKQTQYQRDLCMSYCIEEGNLQCLK